MTQLAAQPLDELERYRGELVGYCYRMLGSSFDADDAVQETMVRAWQRIDGFEGRSSLRSWVYRIATNVCLDALRSRRRRALPMDLSGPVPATTTPTDALPEAAWVTPIADHEVSLHTHDPAARAEARDSLRLAFVAALQHLPPRQRAVLVLREALCWSAAETAELLDTTVASVNSALQRARATLSDRRAADGDGDGDGDQPTVLDDADKDLLARYVAAFESYDIDRLVTLLRDDASISMPPIAMWLRGRDQLHDWYLGHGIGCRGSWLVPIAVNGSQGFAQYRRGPDGSHVAWSIQVLEASAGLISHVHHFLDTALFATFGLPLTLESRPA